MENTTYDEVSVTPVNTDEMYSRIQIKINPSYELRSTAHDHGRINKKGNTNGSQKNTKLIVVLIIMIVLLLLLMVAVGSIVLSVTTYTRLTSEQSKLLGQIDSTKDRISEIKQAVETGENISQIDIKLVQTQLAAVQTNISDTLTELDNKVNDFMALLKQNPSLVIQLYCGPGPWYGVAYLNMNNPNDQCPPAWREYNMSGVRACGRPVTTTSSCPSTQYSIYHQYSRVCGRIIGYQIASPDAFNSRSERNVDGVTITHGNHYIWSYIAGVTENNTSRYPAATKCPCSTSNGQRSESPASIGDNYYCESGNSMSHFRRGYLYPNDKLWDGQQCEGTCCTGANSPPWFSVQLPAPTTDAIEVSICCDQGTSDEDVPIELIELYVQ